MIFAYLSFNPYPAKPPAHGLNFSARLDSRDEPSQRKGSLDVSHGQELSNLTQRAWTPEDRMVEQIMAGRGVGRHSELQRGSPSPVRGIGRMRTPEEGGSHFSFDQGTVGNDGSLRDMPTGRLKTPEDSFGGTHQQQQQQQQQLSPWGAASSPLPRIHVRGGAEVRRMTQSSMAVLQTLTPEETVRRAISRASAHWDTTPKGQRFLSEANFLIDSVADANEAKANAAVSEGRGGGAASVPLGALDGVAVPLAVGGPRRRSSIIMPPPDKKEVRDSGRVSRAVGDKLGSWWGRMDDVERMLQGQGGVLEAARRAVAHMSEELAPRYEKMFREDMKRRRRRGMPMPPKADFLKEGKGVAAWNPNGVNTSF